MNVQIPGETINNHGVQHIISDSNNSIKCGLECLFNTQCDFYLYESVNCYLASYEKTDDTTIVLNSSEILSSQEQSKSPQGPLINGYEAGTS